jgi:hypothetical protein
MSGEEEKRIGDLKEIEAALASLVPRADRLDRDRLMFLAGQASVVRRGQDRVVRVARWAWPSAFAATSAVAAGLLVALLMRWQPGVDDRIAHVAAPVQVPAERAAAPESPQYPVLRTEYPVPGTQYPGLSADAQGAWLRFPRLRDSYHDLLARVLDRGLDAWKAPAGSGVPLPAAPPATYREMLEALLESPSG